MFFFTSVLRGQGVMSIQVGLGQERMCKGQFGCEPLMWLIREEALDKVQGKFPLCWHRGHASGAWLFTQVSAPEAGELSFAQELLIVRFLRMRVYIVYFA